MIDHRADKGAEHGNQKTGSGNRIAPQGRAMRFVTNDDAREINAEDKRNNDSAEGGIAPVIQAPCEDGAFIGGGHFVGFPGCVKRAIDPEFHTGKVPPQW